MMKNNEVFFKRARSIRYSSNIYSYKYSDELDIFSKLPDFVFNYDHNPQCSRVLNAFKDKFFLYLSENRVCSSLPKLVVSPDSESLLLQMKSNWKNGNAMLFLSFEENYEDSSFGIVWNDEEKKYYETKSGSIEKKGINAVVDELISFIFKVY